MHRWCPHKANGGTAAYSVCAPFKGLVAVRWRKSKMATGPQVVCGGSSKECRSFALVVVETNKGRRGTLSS